MSLSMVFGIPATTTLRPRLLISCMKECGLNTKQNLTSDQSYIKFYMMLPDTLPRLVINKNPCVCRMHISVTSTLNCYLKNYWSSFLSSISSNYVNLGHIELSLLGICNRTEPCTMKHINNHIPDRCHGPEYCLLSSRYHDHHAKSQWLCHHAYGCYSRPLALKGLYFWHKNLCILPTCTTPSNKFRTFRIKTNQL